MNFFPRQEAAQSLHRCLRPSTCGRPHGATFSLTFPVSNELGGWSSCRRSTHREASMITRRERVSTGRSNRSAARDLQQQEETAHSSPPQSAYQLPSTRRREKRDEGSEQGSTTASRERARTGLVKFEKASDLVRSQVEMGTARSSRRRSLPLALESLLFRKDQELTPQEVSRVFYDAGIRIPENSANEIVEHYKLTDVESEMERQLLLRNALEIAELKSTPRLLTTSSGNLASSRSDEVADWEEAKKRSKSADLWISLPNFAHTFEGAPRMRTISEESQKNKKKFLEKRSFSVSDIGKRHMPPPRRDSVIKPEESSPSFLRDQACLITIGQREAIEPGNGVEWDNQHRLQKKERYMKRLQHIRKNKERVEQFTKDCEARHDSMGRAHFVDRMAAVDKSQSGIGIGNTRVPGLYDVEYDRKRSTKNLVQIREGPAMERKRLENLERESKIQELQKSHDNLNAMKLEKK
mmetsp:Transcript_41656/g.131284  ORF Transcript_41656/g.131284 Transcript_41656/m.131284 type:complete len:468 (-) Transcript_41656:57-1460(-)